MIVYLDFRLHCNIFTSEPISHVFSCAPAVSWFTGIAFLHVLWISGLCLTLLAQVILELLIEIFLLLLFKIAAGFTTNERINFYRYKYFRSATSSPFSFGWTQNIVDLINRRIFSYIPTNLDWTRIYTIEDFEELIPTRLKRTTNTSAMNLLNV